MSVGRSVNGGIFINAILVTGQSFSIGRKPRSIKVRDLPLEDLPAHSLSPRMEILGVVYPRALDPVRDVMFRAGARTRVLVPRRWSFASAAGAMS